MGVVIVFLDIAEAQYTRGNVISWYQISKAIVDDLVVAEFFP